MDVLFLLIQSYSSVTVGVVRIVLSGIIPRFPIRKGWDRYRQEYGSNFDKMMGQSVTGKAKAI